MEDCKDQKLISGIENVLYDNVPTGKNNNFDVCVRDPLPDCPINAWHNKYGHSKDNEGDMNIEYKRLSDEQTDELREWNKSDAGKKTSENYKKTRDVRRDYPSNEDVEIQHKTKKFRKAVAAAVNKKRMIELTMVLNLMT